MKKALMLSLVAAMSTSAVALAHGGRKAHFERMDANGDGQVTKAEILERKLARFDAADANQDGKLTPEERAEARAQRQAARQGDAGAEGNQKDRAKKGHHKRHHHGKWASETWTREGVSAHIEARFAKLDANGDAVLTRDELRRHKRGRHGDCGKGKAAGETPEQ